ncbi:MAG: DUF4112 domain-containing protein [Myxococcota bacterium]
MSSLPIAKQNLHPEALDAPSTDVIAPYRVPAWLRSLVGAMDDAVRVPGTDLRFGADAVFGFFLPGAGDAATAVSHLALLREAYRAGVPRVVMTRMLMNVAIDAVVGTVPLLGDLFDLGFKANRKNLGLLERHARAPGSTRGDRWFVAGIFAAAVLVLSLPFVALAVLGGWMAGAW